VVVGELEPGRLAHGFDHQRAAQRRVGVVGGDGELKGWSAAAWTLSGEVKVGASLGVSYAPRSTTGARLRRAMSRGRPCGSVARRQSWCHPPSPGRRYCPPRRWPASCSAGACNRSRRRRSHRRTYGDRRHRSRLRRKREGARSGGHCSATCRRGCPRRLSCRRAAPPPLGCSAGGAAVVVIAGSIVDLRPIESAVGPEHAVLDEGSAAVLVVQAAALLTSLVAAGGDIGGAWGCCSSYRGRRRYGWPGCR